MQIRSLALLVLVFGCSKSQTSTSLGKADASPPPQPVDRLLPGELAQSKLLVFGFPIPQGMVVERRFGESVYLKGEVSPSELLAYVKAHALTGPAERIGARRVFSKAKIRGGDPARIYDIEIDDAGGFQRLVVTDVTPPPLEPGLTVEERWRRAGYLPDGTPIASAHGM